MGNITQAVVWIQAHWQDVASAIAYIIAAASVIVKITPTIKDDNILLNIIKFISKYVALNRTVDDETIRKNLGEK